MSTDAFPHDGRPLPAVADGLPTIINRLSRGIVAQAANAAFTSILMDPSKVFDDSLLRKTVATFLGLAMFSREDWVTYWDAFIRMYFTEETHVTRFLKFCHADGDDILLGIFSCTKFPTPGDESGFTIVFKMEPCPPSRYVGEG